MNHFFLISQNEENFQEIRRMIESQFVSEGLMVFQKNREFPMMFVWKISGDKIPDEMHGKYGGVWITKVASPTETTYEFEFKEDAYATKVIGEFYG